MSEQFNKTVEKPKYNNSDSWRELVIEIHAGEGGEDSKLFIYDLLSAYVKYAKNLGFSYEQTASEQSFCSLCVKGEKVFRFFENEIGKHCVQRVPPTERGGRVHTSIVSVAVLPVRNNSSFKLDLKDVEIQITKGSGPGGQARNKLETAIRAIHKPTNLKAFVCNERSQHQNKDMALKILSAKVEDFYGQQENNCYNDNRLVQVGNRKRSDKRRTYNFHRNRVVDHELGTKTSKIDSVMNGRFDLINK